MRGHRHSCTRALALLHAPPQLAELLDDERVVRGCVPRPTRVVSHDVASWGLSSSMFSLFPTRGLGVQTHRNTQNREGLQTTPALTRRPEYDVPISSAVMKAPSARANSFSASSASPRR